MTQRELKDAAVNEVLDLVRHVATEVGEYEACDKGVAIGRLFEGCATVLRAMDEIAARDDVTFSNE